MPEEPSINDDIRQALLECAPFSQSAIIEQADYYSFVLQSALSDSSPPTADEMASATTLLDIQCEVGDAHCLAKFPTPKVLLFSGSKETHKQWLLTNVSSGRTCYNSVFLGLFEVEMVTFLLCADFPKKWRFDKNDWFKLASFLMAAAML